MHRDAARVLVTLFVLIFAAVSHAATRSHEFVLDCTKWNDKPKTVNIGGDFNGWSKDATALKQTKPNIWSVSLDLEEGLHHYKFVIDGERWIGDPNGEKELEEDDNYGGKNSGVMVGADAKKLPPPQANHINVDGILFSPSDPADVNVFAPGLVRVRVRTQAGDVEAIAVQTRNDKVGLPLSKLQTVNGFDTFGGVYHFKPADDGFDLMFKDGTDALMRDNGGPPFSLAKTQFETPDWAKHAVWYQIFPERFRNGDPSNDPKDHWFEKMIPWTANWWKSAPGEAPGADNFYKGEGNVWKRRYGGDIQGIKQELPYLRSLGVTAIYLNPIFEAESMHKYDTADYRHVDDNFGVKGDLPIPGETDDPATWKWSKSDLVFLDFVAEAHRQGFKVICDGVFNHVGRAHPFFQDVVKNGKASKYADWFEIEAWPDKLPAREEDFGKPGGLKFKAWDGDSGHLPVLKKDAQLGLAHGWREHILGITKRWLAPDGDPSKGIDGWRLDVPGDIPHPFWVEWHKLVKTTKPDAYISGEVWTWAQAWLNTGDQFDAVMNYRFAEPVQMFFVNQKTAITPEQFNAKLIELEFNYPMQVAEVQQNLFDSHDTDRAASMFVNPDRAYDAENRIQDNAEKRGYDPRKPNETEWTRFRQEVAFQMSFLGAPMIYYGDECGMWGPDDPSNRQPMIWKDLEPYEDSEVKFDSTQFNWYQKMIAIRRALPALQTGFFRPDLIENKEDVYAFARDLDAKSVYVVLNRSEKPIKLDLPVADGSYVDWMQAADVKQASGADARPEATLSSNAKSMKSDHGMLHVEVKPYGTMILSAK